MSAEGKVERLRRELAEAEKEAGVPVSGEPVAWITHARNGMLRSILATKTPDEYLMPGDVQYPLFANPPHALAATQAEVKRLREALEMAIDDMERCNCDMCERRRHEIDCRDYYREILSTPADTSELDRLVADAGRAKWQPIETAPKDGSDILVFNPVSREQFVAYFERGQWCFSAHHAMREEPTHWMPLTDAPEASRAEVKS